MVFWRKLGFFLTIFNYVLVRLKQKQKQTPPCPGLLKETEIKNMIQQIKGW